MDARTLAELQERRRLIRGAALLLAKLDASLTRSAASVELGASLPLSD